MSEIKICKEFKKAIRELIEEFKKYGGPTDILLYLEVANTSPSVYLDECDKEIALSFAKKNNIDPAICCAIMEISGLMKDRYDKENIGESYPDEYTENYGHLINETISSRLGIPMKK